MYEAGRRGSVCKAAIIACKLFYLFGEAFFKLLHSVITDTPPPHSASPNQRAKDAMRPCVFTIYPNPKQMSLIARYADRALLFCCDDTEKDISAFFTDKKPLHANSLANVTLFFDVLSELRLVDSCWQTIIGNNGLLYSPRTGLPASRASLSSSLSQRKRRPMPNALAELAKELKASQQTDGNTAN